MVTQHSALEIARKFSQEVKAEGIHLRKAFLFGSYAKNQQHEHSDIDIALVADEFIGVGFEDMKLFLPALRKYTAVQTKTYSSKDYEEGDPLIDEIKLTGVEIEIN
jgi:predicted nucleotidyltransferase